MAAKMEAGPMARGRNPRLGVGSSRTSPPKIRKWMGPRGVAPPPPLAVMALRGAPIVLNGRSRGARWLKQKPQTFSRIQAERADGRKVAGGHEKGAVGRSQMIVGRSSKKDGRPLSK